ncbi:MAG: DMT family transporter, partial [Gammaproteobacteria bacterium]|nr:DMT family transporter [Gammaproteobacteria bacterium]
QLLRVLLVIAEVAFFYLAVRELPLADVFLFYLAAPIFVTGLSVVFLGEKVGWPRLIAVSMGFFGVMLIFPPSEAALTIPALIALAGSLSLASMMVLARYLRHSGGFHLITYQTTGVALAGSLTLPLGWVMPDVLDFTLLCILGVVATTAHIMLNHAVKVAPASVVMPFQYTSIIWAMILGYIFWNDIPGFAELSGALLIIVSGLIIFYRESRQQQLAETTEKAVTEV